MPRAASELMTSEGDQDTKSRVLSCVSTEPERPSRTPLLYVILLGLIALGTLGVRLYHVIYPPYSWRDTQTLMIARNYFREGMNLFAPSVNWRNLKEVAPRGLVGGTELNVTPYLTALLYRIFGIQYWVGRVVPIFFSLLGIVCFFRLVLSNV